MTAQASAQCDIRISLRNLTLRSECHSFEGPRFRCYPNRKVRQPVSSSAPLIGGCRIFKPHHTRQIISAGDDGAIVESVYARNSKNFQETHRISQKRINLVKTMERTTRVNSDTSSSSICYRVSRAFFESGSVQLVAAHACE